MIILGSKSERRQKILNFFNLPFAIIDSKFDESKVPVDKNPEIYTTELAKKKAETIAQNYPCDIILTADTVVFHSNEYFLKPSNLDEAYKMLRKLSGSRHEVYTGICVKKNGENFIGCEKTTIFFNHLTEKQIRLFHSVFYFKDKSGGYDIQKAGSIIVKKIEGCFYNVIGLPINTTSRLLLKAGIDLWQYLR